MNKLIIAFCLIGSSYVFAANTINVTVTSNDPAAAAIGYTVNGKKSGSAGKSYTGKGPISGSYSFGYRKSSVKGKDIPCGTHTLTTDSQVMLVSKGSKCRSIVKS